MDKAENTTAPDPERTTLEGRIYDSLVAFNKDNHWDVLRLAQMRQHLTAHLTNDLITYYRDAILNKAIDAARGEYLHDQTGTPEDEAYNQAVSDVVAAIGALLEGKQ